MVRGSMMGKSVLALAICLAMGMPSSWAQDQEDRRERRGNRDGRARLGQLDDRTQGATVRVSQLIGTNITNQLGQNVGEVEDLVIDASRGRVRYVAVTYGGFLELGDKLFAVPFEAFQVGHEANDPSSVVLVLNVTQQQLEGAQGFDEDNWPNFADRTFTAELDRRYRVERRGRIRDRVRDVDVDVDRNGINVDLDRDDADPDGVDVDVDADRQ